MGRERAHFVFSLGDVDLLIEVVQRHLWNCPFDELEMYVKMTVHDRCYMSPLGQLMIPPDDRSASCGVCDSIVMMVDEPEMIPVDVELVSMGRQCYYARPQRTSYGYDMTT